MTGAALTQKVEEGINWFERNLVAADQQEKLEIRDFQLRPVGGVEVDQDWISSLSRARFKPKSSPTFRN